MMLESKNTICFRLTFYIIHRSSAYYSIACYYAFKVSNLEKYVEKYILGFSFIYTATVLYL